MTTIQFAKASGIVFERCDPMWNGPYAYKLSNKTKLRVCGFKSQKEAAEGWLEYLIQNENALRIIKQLIEAAPAK